VRRGATLTGLLLFTGCYASHVVEGASPSDGAVRRDAGSAIRVDGSVPPPPPPPGTDAGDPPPPPPPPPPRTWRERCESLCPRLIECGAIIESLDQCIRGCVRSERDFTEPACRDLANAALDCLDGLACSDLEGLQPEETVCAPFFARYEMRCGR